MTGFSLIGCTKKIGFIIINSNGVVFVATLTTKSKKVKENTANSIIYADKGWDNIDRNARGHKMIATRETKTIQKYKMTPRNSEGL